MNHSFNTTLAEKYGLECAVIIEHLFWWIHKNECEDIEEMFHEGRMWCRTTTKGIAKYITYIGWQTIRRKLIYLEEKKVLMVGNFNTKSTNQTLWYSFTDSFKNELKELNYDFSKMKNGIFKNEKSNNSIINNPINEYNIKEDNKKRLSNDNQKKEYSDDFLEFYKQYGNPVSKYKSYLIWRKLSEADKKSALAALPAYIAYYKEHGITLKHPSTYLNQRTWEDDFTSPEKKEETIADARAPMDVDQWERNQRWMEENTPKYVGKISFDDFISMRGEVMLNSRIYGEILKEMHQSGYEGDIVAEFKRRNDERICSHG